MKTSIPPTDIAVFGTLCDPELLKTVLGTVADAQPVDLPDRAVFWAKGQNFPFMKVQAGAQAQALLLRDLTGTQVARLDFYEAIFGYSLARLDLPDGHELGHELGQGAKQGLEQGLDVWFYQLEAATFEQGDAWSLALWQDTYGPFLRDAAQEIMELFGQVDPAQIGPMLGPIRSRAQARVNARAQAVPNDLRHGFSRDDVVLKAQRRPYSKFFAVDEIDISHRRFDGGENLIERAVFVMADAVVVLPYDPVRDTVLLIEQFRAAPYVRGEANPWCLEAIAGRIDGGETPHQAAHREAEEEGGVAFSGLVEVAQFYSSPGAVVEYLYCYIGLADLPDSAAGFGGLEAEHEDIRSMVVPFAKLMEAVSRGEVQNGPLLMCALCLERERAGLRAAATAA